MGTQTLAVAFVDNNGVLNSITAVYQPMENGFSQYAIVIHKVLVNGVSRIKSIIQCETYDTACLEVELLKEKIFAQ